MRPRRSGKLRHQLALLLTAALVFSGLVAQSTATAAGDEAPEVHGLKGEYYTQSAPGAFDFHELKATGFDRNIDFDTLEPRLNLATGKSDDATVRWTGKLVPEKSGAHTFAMTGDNGFRLWVDGKLAIDHWVDDWDREQTSQPIELAAGKAHDFKVEYFEHYGGSNLHLRWTEPGGTKKAVPQSAFRLPDGWDYDGATDATVQKDGRALRLEFAQELAAPPAGLVDHLEAVIGGAKWPLDSVRQDPADPRHAPARHEQVGVLHDSLRRHRPDRRAAHQDRRRLLRSARPAVLDRRPADRRPRPRAHVSRRTAGRRLQKVRSRTIYGSRHHPRPRRGLFKTRRVPNRQTDIRT